MRSLGPFVALEAGEASLSHCVKAMSFAFAKDSLFATTGTLRTRVRSFVLRAAHVVFRMLNTVERCAQAHRRANLAAARGVSLKPARAGQSEQR